MGRIARGIRDWMSVCGSHHIPRDLRGSNRSLITSYCDTAAAETKFLPFCRGKIAEIFFLRGFNFLYPLLDTNDTKVLGDISSITPLTSPPPTGTQRMRDGEWPSLIWVLSHAPRNVSRSRAVELTY